MSAQIEINFKEVLSIIVEQIRIVALNTRWWATTGEVLPDEFVDRVVETFKVIID